MFKLAFRNIFRHKMRTTLTLAAIIFGVVGLILSGGFVDDLLHQLRERTIHSQLGHLQIYKAGYSVYGSRNPFKYTIDLPQKVVEQVNGLPHVKDVMLRLNFSGLINNGRADLSIIGEGVEPDKEAILGSFLTIISGRQLRDSDMFGIMLGEGVADSMNLKPGDHVTILLNTPEGALNTMDFQVIGVFRSISKDFDARAVRISLPAAQELLTNKAINSIVVSLDETRYTDTVANQLVQKLDMKSYELKRWYELSDFYENTVGLYQTQFGILKIIILFMVVLSVVNSVNMTIFERTGEFGTLMALGNRTTTVFRLVITENVMLGLIGGLGGIIVGIILAQAITAIGIPMPPPPNSSSGYIAAINVVPSVLALGFLIGFIGTALASILPARRIARLPVAEALRHNR